jgi:hypothetical protein
MQTPPTMPARELLAAIEADPLVSGADLAWFRAVIGAGPRRTASASTAARPARAERPRLATA